MSDDLTRLTDEEREALWQSGEVSIINCDYDSNLVAAVESILAARTAALIDRAERAERERDRLAVIRERLIADKEAWVAKFKARESEDVDDWVRSWKEACAERDALRAAVTGLADQWDEQRSHYPTATDARAVGAEAAVKLCSQELRALLTDGGDNQ